MIMVKWETLLKHFANEQVRSKGFSGFKYHLSKYTQQHY